MVIFEGGGWMVVACVRMKDKTVFDVVYSVYWMNRQIDILSRQLKRLNRALSIDLSREGDV